jgi:hypothetical protein
LEALVGSGIGTVQRGNHETHEIHEKNTGKNTGTKVRREGEDKKETRLMGF